jgi:hypothetical protein
MPAASKRAKKVHTGTEYDVVRVASRLRPPKRANGSYAWSLEQIRAARDSQLAGKFRQPALLAAAMRTDDALFVAYQNRLAPQRGLPVEVRAAGESARAVRIREEADALFGPKGVGVAPGALESINGDLANHGVAFGINIATPREDGSRIDVELHHWPIEGVRWDAIESCYYTQIEPDSGSEADKGGRYGYSEIPIQHGDGRWVVFSKHEHEPWRQEACVLPAALVWADHAFGRRDRSKHSVAVGGEKWIGSLPEGVGTDTPEGAALEDMCETLATEENAVGLEPFGAKIRREVNDSSAWQNFKEIIDGNGLSAQRIYNGQDATAGSQSAGPGVDASRLWGVRNDIVEGDLGAIERGIFEGTLTPWCAWNFGDSSLAPWRKYLLPDPDESSRRESEGALGAAFFAELKAAREAGFKLEQTWVDERAKAYGLKAPLLPVAAPAALSIVKLMNPNHDPNSGEFAPGGGGGGGGASRPKASPRERAAKKAGKLEQRAGKLKERADASTAAEGAARADADAAAAAHAEAEAKHEKNPTPANERAVEKSAERANAAEEKADEASERAEEDRDEARDARMDAEESRQEETLYKRHSEIEGDDAAIDTEADAADDAVANAGPKYEEAAAKSAEWEEARRGIERDLAAYHAHKPENATPEQWDAYYDQIAGLEENRRTIHRGQRAAKNRERDYEHEYELAKKRASFWRARRKAARE